MTGQADDPRAELAALAADVRALLEDAAGRGVVDRWPEEIPTSTVDPGAPPSSDPVAASVPAPDPLRAAGVPAPDPLRAAGVPAPDPLRWAAMAEAARQAQPEPAEALRRVAADLGDCRRCGLCQGRRNIVFGVGSPTADLVVVGEGPGQQEDLRGEPFVGPAGEMLDKMLERVLGLSRDEVYICNVVKCRPPGNRDPLPDEVTSCMPFLERQIEALQPKVMLVLGRVAFQSLFGADAGIKRSRGQWTQWRGVPAMPTFHPAYLLRQPNDKRLVFEDLKAVKARYDELNGRRR